MIYKANRIPKPDSRAKRGPKRGFCIKIYDRSNKSLCPQAHTRVNDACGQIPGTVNRRQIF